YSHSDDLHVVEPIVTVNGYDASRFPVAYLAEVIDTHVDPGNSGVLIRGKTYTAALGLQPMHELNAFFYANRLDIENAELGRSGVPGVFQKINGTIDRFDGGLRYAPSARQSLWLKAGASRQKSVVDETDRVSGVPEDAIQQLHFTFDPRASDVAL